MSKLKYSMKNKKGSKTGKGFYVALSICIVAVGAACWSTYGSIQNYFYPTDTAVYTNTDTEEEKQDAQTGLNLTDVIDTDTDKGKAKTTDTEAKAKDTETENHSVNTDTEASVTSEEDNEAAAVISNTYLYPVGKQILKDYSGENLVYSKTMGDWRVHQGTDFSADAGKEVKPITTGTVKDIYTDNLLGVTIVIDHGNGVEAYYSGLGTTTLVKVGDKVSVGDYIGSVKTVPSECLEEPHLHLAIKVNGSFVDPMTLIEK